MKKLNIGLVGAGRMADFHIAVLKDFSDVKLNALVTTPKGIQRRKEYCNIYDIPNGFDNVEDMISSKTVDAVFIQPSVQHVFEISKKCLQAGLHTLIEKPPGLSSQETRELLWLAKKMDVVQMVGLQRRFYSHILEAKKLIEERGKLYSIVVEASERFQGIKDKNKFTDEVLQKWIFANGIHMVDMLLFLGGEVENATHLVRQWDEKVTSDSYHSLVEFKNGTVGQYYSNWSSPGGWLVKLFGKGIRIDIGPMEQAKIITASGTTNMDIPKHDIDYKPGLFKQNRMFVDACLNKGKVQYPGATLLDSLNAMKFIEQMVSF